MQTLKRILIGLGLLILSILYLKVGEGFWLFCPIYKFTGLYCPGCGITRMLSSILNGNFYQAFRYNPLVFLLIPFMIFHFTDSIIAFYKKRKTVLEKYEPYVWYVLIGIFMVYGVLRNVPLFSFLKPTSI